uniref:Beta-defensin n=1 Tax=Nomascus leucogenys TaxID=61853 RepID=A0A2I3FZM0_NOMLE
MLRIYLLLSLMRSEFEWDRICGYGTARCRNKCRSQEYRIGRCPNTFACCLRKWDESLLNSTKP